MVGDASDTALAVGLTGATHYPFIATTSIAIPDTYYWAKILLSKGGTTFSIVQYSNDGTLLISHGYSAYGYIVIFDAVTGAVLSARSYSSNGYSNYNHLVKSMVISSGNTPMAYVLSNYATSSSCTGQHLFKFDPTTITTPSWTKKTTGTNNCGHLGLKFGRSESLLYAFSWFNSLST
jgi:hypothetical protein